MKKTICFLLAFIMLMALMAAPAAAEEETVPTETAAPVTEPAPDSADPVGEPAPEIPAEPAPEVPTEPAPEVPTEPAPETPTEPTEPTEEPAEEAAPTETPAEPEAMATSLEPEPAPEPEQPRSVALHCTAGVFPGDYQSYPTIKTPLEDGDKLPDLKALDCEPSRPGYRFMGWYKDEAYASYDAAVAADAQPVGYGEAVPAEVNDLYASWVRTVVLDAAPGSFVGGEQTYTRTVDLVNGTLPGETDVPVYSDSVTFVGWFTQMCTMTQVPDESSGQGFWTWSITNNGSQITAGQSVPEGVTTLYAGYQVKEGVAAAQKVTFYYDLNGMGGRYGQSMTVTRAYNADAKGYPLTWQDLLVRYISWNGENDVTFSSWADVTNYWNNTQILYMDEVAYTFKGWATDPKDDEPNVAEGTVVKNGQSLYAVWEKDGTTSKDFDREPPTIGPVENMHFVGNLNYSRHAEKNASLTLNLFCAPLGCDVEDLTWTLTYSDGYKVANIIPNTVTATVTEAEPFYDPAGGFMAQAIGQSLTITDLDGNAYYFTVSATATGKNGETVTVNASANAGFNHSVSDWQTKQAPTCTEYGYELGHCTGCGKEVTRKLYPLQHSYNFNNPYATKGSEPTCTENGTAYMCCYRCGVHYKDADGKESTQTVAATGHSFDANGYCPVCKGQCKVGDANLDGKVNSKDILRIFRYTSKQSTEAIPMRAGDANKDGKINTKDILRIFRYTSKQVDTLE